MEPIEMDIADISKSYTDGTQHSPTATISMMLFNEQHVIGQGHFVLNSLIYDRNYVKRIGDYIEISFTMLRGTFIHKVYPFLNNTDIGLKIREVLSKDGKKFRQVRYRAIYLIDKNQGIDTSTPGTEDDLNQTPPILITMQLIDKSVETLRVKTTQGSFDRRVHKGNNMRAENLLKAIIGEQTNKVLVDGRPSITRFEIEPFDNKEALLAVNLPSNTRVLRIPTLLQEQTQGLYASGIGTYIQTYNGEESLFIYSLYDGNKYRKQERKIDIFIPPTNMRSTETITYKQEGDVLRLFTLHNTEIIDALGAVTSSEGGGVRVSNANSFMSKPVVINDQGVVFKKSRLNTELMVAPSASGVNFAPNQGISNNIFHEISKVKQRGGKYIDLTWLNANPDLIFPGAACCVNYVDRFGKLVKRYGVIHSVITNYTSTGLNPILGLSRRSVETSIHTNLIIFFSP